MYAKTVIPPAPAGGLTVHQIMFNRYTDHVDMEFDSAVSALAEKFRCPLWITEWHMGVPDGSAQDDIKV